MVVALPHRKALQLIRRNRILIHERHVQFPGNLLCPMAELMLIATQFRTIRRTVFLRRQRHQHRIGALRTDVGHIAAKIAAIRVNHLLAIGRVTLVHHLHIHQHRVRSRSRNTGTRTPLVVRTVVVMTDTHNHPVARLQSLTNLRPQVTVERTARRTAQSLILHRDPLLVEEVLSKIAPAPLAVVTVAQRTVAHRTVTNQEKHRIAALTTRSRFDTRRPHLVERVQRQVRHFVQILHRLQRLSHYRHVAAQESQQQRTE